MPSQRRALQRSWQTLARYQSFTVLCQPVMGKTHQAYQRQPDPNTPFGRRRRTEQLSINLSPTIYVTGVGQAGRCWVRGGIKCTLKLMVFSYSLLDNNPQSVNTFLATTPISSSRGGDGVGAVSERGGVGGGPACVAGNKRPTE